MKHATRERPAPLDAVLTLAPGRAHELCGPARRVLAAWVMAGQAPVLWLRLRHDRDRLCPQGLADWTAPDGLILAEAGQTPELLGCAEDALRSGACALVVADLPGPVALTPLRRLHLAAEDGQARRRTQRAAGPRALVLTPEGGGTPGVESRWQLTPCPAADSPPDDPVRPAWQLTRLRARMAPPACWQVAPAPDGLRCTPAPAG